MPNQKTPGGIQATCTSCSGIISGTRKSTGNFLSHIKRRHKEILSSCQLYCSAKSLAFNIPIRLQSLTIPRLASDVSNKRARRSQKKFGKMTTFPSSASLPFKNEAVEQKMKMITAVTNETFSDFTPMRSDTSTSTNYRISTTPTTNNTTTTALPSVDVNGSHIAIHNSSHNAHNIEATCEENVALLASGIYKNYQQQEQTEMHNQHPQIHQQQHHHHEQQHIRPSTNEDTDHLQHHLMKTN